MLKITGEEYVISDTHFSHSNIIKYCDRPFKNYHSMNERMVELWNNTVTDDDIIFHLGDVTFGKLDDSINVLKRLNGRLILIKGNHDRGSNLKLFRKHDIFETIYEGNHYQPWQYDEQVLLSHGPVAPEVINDNQLNIHGHIHNTPLLDLDCYAGYDENKYINVSVEMIGYRPIKIKDILNVRRLIDENNL
jgi:calcineurin-like phosphoesterase family protein